jgi:hypothetical protein
VRSGDVAQLGERRLCKPEVAGSIPVVSSGVCPDVGRGETLRIGAANRSRGRQEKFLRNPKILIAGDIEKRIIPGSRL